MYLDYAALDDQTLIGLILHRQSEALSVLYDRYSRLVYSLALQMLDDAMAAEEVTLDVFNRVWQRAESYRANRGSVSTWLSGIARNRAIDRIRRLKARPEGHSITLDAVAHRLHASTPGPERKAHLALQREQLYAALEGLPEEQRRVLLLAYFGGFTQREIADALELPLGTVKTRVRLGMEKLRAELVDHVDVPGE